jgi:hypothetical protein
MFSRMKSARRMGVSSKDVGSLGSANGAWAVRTLEGRRGQKRVWGVYLTFTNPGRSFTRIGCFIGPWRIHYTA